MIPGAASDDSTKENHKSKSVDSSVNHTAKKQEVRQLQMLQPKLCFQKLVKADSAAAVAQPLAMQAQEHPPLELKLSEETPTNAFTDRVADGQAEEAPPSKDLPKKDDITGNALLPSQLQPRQQVFSIFLPAAERKRLIQEVTHSAGLIEGGGRYV